MNRSGVRKQQPGSFNRYIVECKFRIITFSWLKLTGFNRYIVECKFDL